MNVVMLLIFMLLLEQKEFSQPTFGQPAADWIIKVDKGISKWNNDEYYKFQVFDNSNNNGFRFTLDREKTEAFANWLEEMNDWALIECGCPI